MKPPSFVGVEEAKYWLMGLPAGWVTDVPGLSRSQLLRLLGNGVVPQQGEAAIRYLIQLGAVARAA